MKNAYCMTSAHLVEGLNKLIANAKEKAYLFHSS